MVSSAVPPRAAPLGCGTVCATIIGAAAAPRQLPRANVVRRVAASLPRRRRVAAASSVRPLRRLSWCALPGVSRRYRCSRCAELVVASKRLTLHTLPNVLTVGAQCRAGGLSLGLPLLPHLHRDWAHPCPTCTATAARASAVLSGTRACHVLTPLVLRRGGWLWLLTRTGPRAVHSCAGHGAVLFQTTSMDRFSGSAHVRLFYQDV